MAQPEIVRGYVPGTIGRIVEMHGTYYAAHWGFSAFFEARMARELAEFIDRYDGKRDGLWTAVVAGRIEGSIAIDGSRAGEGGAHLRWFILEPGLHGQGTGRRLLGEAVGFCRSSGHRLVSLWTFAGLDAARRLYEQAGFRLVEERRGAQWGIEVDEQRFELRLTDG
ncbi:MAG: GNAT family N-acetyltransferase [Candidatus Methylomirabilia bacterium]